MRRRTASWSDKLWVATMVAALVTVGLPHGAMAAEPAPPGPPVMRKIALFVLPKTKTATDDAKVLQSVMRTELQRMVGVRAVSGSGEPPMALGQVVLPSVESGYRALDARSFQAARDAFEKAYRDITSYSGPVDRRLMARVLKGLAASRIMSGAGEDGDVAIDTSLNVWPNQQLGEWGWGLDLRTAFNEVQDRKATTPTGSLEIEVEPPGAAIRVNGELKGFAPVEVKDLPAGRHWVEAQIDGYRWSGLFVEVPAGESAIHAVELETTAARPVFEQAMKQLEKGVAKGQVAGPMADLQRTLGADMVLVLVVAQGRNAYTFEGWQREAGEPQRVSRTIPDDAKFVAGVREWVATLARTQPMADDSELPLDQPPGVAAIGAGDLVINPDDEIFRTGKRKDDDSITSEWWFWAIVGGAAAGLVGGGYALLSGADEGSGPSGTVRLQVNRLP
ncbi:MAG: PEGA domain-containing protein [Deltaproteobacteria bacterium]|nr:PEGA domain-containing protein [Deltaproteobacteria bacterium]